MNTPQTNQKSSPRNIRKSIKSAPTENVGVILPVPQGEFKSILVADIAYSPLNYRKYFPPGSLETFATEIILHGVISPITVRLLPSGSYELIAGERRLRACNIAGIATIPAIIKNLTDEEVVELQLSENLHREDPHPMHEAQAIAQMQQSGRNITEISTRLCKSKQFIYNRIKLLSLIDEFQQIFLADKMNTQDALEIASISPESQKEYFDQHCEAWENDKDFILEDVRYDLSRFKYDLKNAAFNLTDKNLIPQAGACTKCPHNTATLESLFPEEATQAICRNKECYQKKCNLHFIHILTEGINQHQPQALIFNRIPSPLQESILSLNSVISQLPQQERSNVTLVYPPELPDIEDYSNTGNEDELQFDEDGYNAAMEEYSTDLDAFNQQAESEVYQKALLVGNGGCKMGIFTPRPPGRASTESQVSVTSKQVQTALKEGNATPELLQAEIHRINDKEKRNKELDRQKVQQTIRLRFNQHIHVTANNTPTDADLIATRLLIYQSLDFTRRRKLEEIFWSNDGKEEEQSLLDKLASLSDQQHSQLVRTALANKSDSQYPSQDTAQCLYKVAESAGINVAAIEKAQDEKIKIREERQQGRVIELERKISKLQK